MKQQREKKNTAYKNIDLSRRRISFLDIDYHLSWNYKVSEIHFLLKKNKFIFLKVNFSRLFLHPAGQDKALALIRQNIAG